VCYYNKAYNFNNYPSAKFENNLRKERQVNGIKNALNNGVKFGRPPKLNTQLCKAIFVDRQNWYSISALCNKY